MALNLGRGGVINPGASSAQMLSTAAIFRGEAEKQAKAQAGLELQTMRDEADQLGISMKRMGELQPDRFRAASATLLGGGQRGIDGANKMHTEILAGPETLDQLEKWKESDYGQKFLADLAYAPSDFNKAREKFGTSGGQTDTQESTGSGETETVPLKEISIRMSGLVENDTDGTKRKTFIADMVEEAKTNTDPKFVAAFEKLMGSEFKSNEGNVALIEMQDLFESGEVAFGGKPGDFGESNRILSNEDSYTQFLDVKVGELENAEKEQLKVYVDLFKDLDPDKRFYAMEYIKRRDEEGFSKNGTFEIVDPEGSGGIPANIYMDMLENHSIDLNALPKPGSTGSSFTPLDLNFSGDTTREVEIQPQPSEQTPTAPLPEEDTTEYFVSKRADLDRWRRGEGGLTGQVAQEMRDAIEQEETIKQKAALTDVYGAQEASALGNLELAYGSAQIAAADAIAASGEFGKDVTDAAKIYNTAFVKQLFEIGIKSPPEKAIGNKEEFAKWFETLTRPQRTAYVDATQEMAFAIGANEALAEQWESVEVEAPSGLLNWGNKPATVIVPKGTTDERSNNRNTFIRILNMWE